MNFSPYSPSPDEDRTSRTPKKSKQQYNQPSFTSYQSGNADSYAEQGLLSDNGASSSSSAGLGGSSSSSNGQSVRVNKYETTLPIRVDVEASLAYVLGPVTGKKRLFCIILGKKCID